MKKLPAIGAAMIALTACVSTEELESARAAETEAEQAIEKLELLPPTTELTEALARAREVEALLEAQRIELESQTGEAWTHRAFEAVGRAVGGNAAEGVGILGLGLFGLLRVLTRRKTDPSTDELRAEVQDLMREFEQTMTRGLELQGIASPRARSAELTSSPVALTVKRAEEIERASEIQRAVEAQLAGITQITSRTAVAPPPTPQEASPPLHNEATQPSAEGSWVRTESLSGGAGVPVIERPPQRSA